MRQDWQAVTFAHWRFDPVAVDQLLPSGLRTEPFGGSAWVGVVAFRMADTRPPGVPWLSTFPELNVRTYVLGPDGLPGLWFFSLDAARLAVVAAGRAGYGLPYCWSRMRVDVAGGRVAYRSRRRWPGPRGAACRLAVDVGAPLPEPDELARWLTERYRVYTRVAGRWGTVAASHPPWALATASLVEQEESVLTGAGLPRPAEPPLLHHSAGTHARLGRWRRLPAG
jgi:uncharacterized protein YqjF (DUF2071 family)